MQSHGIYQKATGETDTFRKNGSFQNNGILHVRDIIPGLLKGRKGRKPKILFADVTRATHNAQLRPLNNKPKIKDPKKFSDKEKDKLRPFLGQIQLRASSLGTDQDKLQYAVSLLNRDARQMILHYILHDRIDLSNLDALFTILRSAYDDSDRRATAMGKLNTMR